ncbi:MULTISPECIES: FAD-dependent oxidoreductase [unclassified Arthrobacter]|uniref:FAD-dependent oxidoreductase n=1 Tax=unclassified Arthrobacter TaxID=235627 RepID=UPI002E04B5A8|nr:MULTISPECIES: FAD-dependent oxidoreductase [unclassified Arthrobacter]MEC5192216.1 sarcosine oxidase [Arthrobacter sp. MP_M4]MEC5203742.1 sarcosine oxidase [Arthrobacter sp. MP_M7]
MKPSLDTVVIGGGAMGSAATWALASRGRAVTLLEQFSPGHRNGASHGTTRNFNPGYADPDYAAMLAEAARWWDELEADGGERLLTRTGVVNHGTDPRLDRVQGALHAAGLRADFLTAAEAAERWRGIRFDQRALHMPDGGQLNPDAALPVLQRLAAGRGAEIRHRTKVLDVAVADDGVRLTIDSGGRTEVLTARQAVVTAGAWTAKLLGAVALPRLTVTQEQPGHFAIADRGAAWPGFNHVPGDGPEFADWYSPVYGMQTPGEGVKAGWHGVGPVTDPDRRSFTPEPTQRAALQRYARRWLPGVDADSLTDISCTCTTTVDENFILDRIGPLVVGAGFSGHGFKFTPVIGRVLADLATGEGPAPGIFSASRPGVR